MPAMEPEVVKQKKDETLGVLSKSSRLLGDSGVGHQVPSAADGSTTEVLKGTTST